MNIDKAYKIRLIEHCLQAQETALSNARQVMDDAQEEANNYGPPKDRYDGFRNQQMRRRDLYGKRLEQAVQNISLLKSIDPMASRQSIGFGSLVVTDSTIFFVAIGMGLVQFEDEDVAVVSMLVPVYHVMKGKRVGDGFSLNENSYKVLDIL